MAGELRFDPLTREWVSIVGHRQARPNLPDSGCPFCVGGLEAPEPYEVRWFTNRWPAFDAGLPLDLDAAEAAETRALPAVGTTEVVLFSPDHHATLSTLPLPQVRKVVDVWAARTTALYERDDVEYVLVFENRGAEVGATISHPHGQIYGFGFVPPVPRREADVARRAGRMHGVRRAPGRARRRRPHRVRVGHVGGLRAIRVGLFVRSAHRGARTHRVVSGARRHGPRRTGFGVARRARALRPLVADGTDGTDGTDGNERDEVGSFPYLLWFHQAAKHDDGTAHLHAHTAPPLRAPGVMRFVASGEVGGGTLSNPVVPEDAAATLRAL